MFKLTIVHVPEEGEEQEETEITLCEQYTVLYTRKPNISNPAEDGADYILQTMTGGFSSGLEELGLLRWASKAVESKLSSSNEIVYLGD